VELHEPLIPDDHDVYYYIEWGDDEIEDWIGPYESGEEVTISHTWAEQGAFTIRAKAKDIYDAESDWGTLEVEMPVNYNLNQQSTNLLFFQILQRILNIR